MISRFWHVSVPIYFTEGHMRSHILKSFDYSDIFLVVFFFFNSSVRILEFWNRYQTECSV